MPATLRTSAFGGERAKRKLTGVSWCFAAPGALRLSLATERAKPCRGQAARLFILADGSHPLRMGARHGLWPHRRIFAGGAKAQGTRPRSCVRAPRLVEVRVLPRSAWLRAVAGASLAAGHAHVSSRGQLHRNSFPGWLPQRRRTDGDVESVAPTPPSRASRSRNRRSWSNRTARGSLAGSEACGVWNGLRFASATAPDAELPFLGGGGSAAFGGKRTASVGGGE